MFFSVLQSAFSISGVCMGDGIEEMNILFLQRFPFFFFQVLGYQNIKEDVAQAGKT
jgi:hypothetical protein